MLGLRKALSDERFQRYCDETGGDEAAALHLYTWNTAVSAAFYGPIQACEITLRNGIHDRLVAAYNPWWFRNSRLVHPPEARIIQETEDKIKNVGNTVTPGHLVAELSFGFWVRLFNKSYDELWRSHLYRLFSPKPKRADLREQLDRIRTLRNRIAHHEPIFHRNLMDDAGRLRDVTKRLSPAVNDWVNFHSRVYDVLADRPIATRF